MFADSSQKKSWIFQSEQELQEMRQKANREYLEIMKSNVPGPYLTAEEEVVMIKEYVVRLRKFCQDYRDPRDNRVTMPLYVSCTATHYFQRFYLYNSVMDFHPRDLMHVCIYLACKVEEFYVSINDYIQNVQGTEEEKRNISTSILNSELLTSQELQFNLIVHQPYRPVEGLLIDIKTRFSVINDGEKFRASLDDFLEKVHHTDIILIFSPSQIALAAVTSAAGKIGQRLDGYVTDVLFQNDSEKLKSLIDSVRRIKKQVKNYSHGVSAEGIKNLEEKLERCRNPENDVRTEEYLQKQTKLEQDDDEQLPLSIADMSGIEETPVPDEDWTSEYGGMDGIKGVGLNMRSDDEMS